MIPLADAAAHGATPPDSVPTDTGGGFGGLVLPSGAYVVKGDQVRWVPAVDVTIAMLASLSLVRVLARKVLGLLDELFEIWHRRVPPYRR